MKLNKSKAKGKGKIHPSPSSSSSSSSSSFSFSLSSTSTDPISALNLLLPAAILTLISALSLQDREVLAYMITHSLKSSPPTANSSLLAENPNRKPKKSPHPTSPSFDCDCFECYTAYWFHWDSSPNRELIHQAIEAFEEHLASAEQEQPKKTGRNRRNREKDRTTAQKSSVSEVEAVKNLSPEIGESSLEIGASPAPAEEEESKVKEGEESRGPQQQQQQRRSQAHKGLARKVLPDVIGLFNSRLWNLWGPNV